MTTAAPRGEADRRRHLERIAEVRAGRQAAKVGYPIGIRELDVLRTRPLSPNLVRLTLGGPALAGFESHVPVEHVRLVFPDPDTGLIRAPEPDGMRLRWPRPFPPSREYTVRRHDADAGEIDLDFVIHPGGLASEWAVRARPGDRMHVAGPPGGLVVPDGYDRYLLAGDLTALPAIARWLEGMAPDTRGWAFVETPDPGDRLEPAHPPGVEVRWVEPGGLEAAVRTVRAPAGETVYAWLAGEAGALRPLRGWVRAELGLGPGDSSISGYWKRGVTDYEEDD